jgi:hypothetical protein
VGRQTDDRTVAEHIVLAVNQAQFVSEIEIARIEPALRRDVRVHTGVPFVALHQHRCIGNEGIAADMVEIKMRSDDQIDARRVPIDCYESSADLLARPEADPEQPSKARAQPPSRVMLTIGVQSGIEQRPASWLLNQKDRYLDRDISLATLHQVGEFGGHRAASERVEFDRHNQYSCTSGLACGQDCRFGRHRQW